MIRPFPRIPHFPGSNAGPDDLVLHEGQAAAYFQVEAIALEKLDGINVAVARAPSGALVADFRGEWDRSSIRRLRRAIGIYLRSHELELESLVGPHDTLYGEWLYHRLTIPYVSLDDDFVGFALRRGDAFLAFDEATARIEGAGLIAARPIFRGRLRDMRHLRSLVGTSSSASARMEGLIVEVDHTHRWAKWVEPGYEKPERGKLFGQLNATRPTGVGREPTGVGRKRGLKTRLETE
ncbi:MAG: RNA ligase family protein [Deltaproteobacteria bacterium]|nr:RNA ligase family protein [Deltaproteobacteria bacterium]